MYNIKKSGDATFKTSFIYQCVCARSYAHACVRTSMCIYVRLRMGVCGSVCKTPCPYLVHPAYMEKVKVASLSSEIAWAKDYSYHVLTLYASCKTEITGKVTVWGDTYNRTDGLYVKTLRTETLCPQPLLPVGKTNKGCQSKSRQEYRDGCNAKYPE